jgi:hypothetical protein
MPMWASQISASWTARSASASTPATPRTSGPTVVCSTLYAAAPAEQDEAESLPHVEDERPGSERGSFHSQEDPWHESDILA